MQVKLLLFSYLAQAQLSLSTLTLLQCTNNEGLLQLRYRKLTCSLIYICTNAFNIRKMRTVIRNAQNHGRLTTQYARTTSMHVCVHVNAGKHQHMHAFTYMYDRSSLFLYN